MQRHGCLAEKSGIGISGSGPPQRMVMASVHVAAPSVETKRPGLVGAAGASPGAGRPHEGETAA